MKRLKLLYILLFVMQVGCHYDTGRPAIYDDIDLVTTSSIPVLTGDRIISTALYERDIAIAPGMDEIIFTRGDYKQNIRCLIGTRKINGLWGQTEVLNISGVYHDIEPFLSNAGTRLYFASNRPIYGDSLRSDYNIWYSDRFDDNWSEPIPLDSLINTKGDEFFPSLSSRGNLYFTATRANGTGLEDIFISELVNGKYQMPEPLSTGINTSFYEFNAFISPGEEYIIFSSYGRNNDSGGGDLYISEKDDSGKWQKARNLGERINSPGLDYCPFVDVNEKTFYFTSERLNFDNKKIKNNKELERVSNSTENGFGNIYKISFEALRIKK